MKNYMVTMEYPDISVTVVTRFWTLKNANEYFIGARIAANSISESRVVRLIKMNRNSKHILNAYSNKSNNS